MLGEVSQEPGLLQKMMSTVENAKQEVAALKAKADASQDAASGSDSEGPAVDPGVLAATVAAVQETASDVQAVLDRVKAAIQEAEELPQVDVPWVHQGELALWSVRSGCSRAGDAGRPRASTPFCRAPPAPPGFLSAYDSIRPQVISFVDTLLEDEEEQWTLYITGHSLGAALATLCAYDLSLRT